MSARLSCGVSSLAKPVGVSFFGPRWSEPRLIALAYAFEQATGVRQIPTLAPSLALAADRPGQAQITAR
jgi:Asp-tRNA(Asn)/Glu-tRNA(Gln) amidotransferase A subunit family amidase